MDQPLAGAAPHLLDGVRTFVERIARVPDARQGPARPIFAALWHDFPLALRLGFASRHHVKAVWTDDAPLFWPLRLHDVTPFSLWFQGLLAGHAWKHGGQSVQGACSAPENRIGGASCTTSAWR